MGRGSPARDAGGAAGLGRSCARSRARSPAGSRSTVPCRSSSRRGCACRSSSAGSNRWCCFRPPRSRACRLRRSKRSWRTSWRTSAATTISSISCSRPSRRCCSITRRSGGSRVRCAPSASIAATTSRSEVCDRLVYVSALSDLARMTTAHGAALAATDGSLVRRVRRLLGADAGPLRSVPARCAVLTLIVLGAVAVPVVLTSREVAAPPSGHRDPGARSRLWSAALPASRSTSRRHRKLRRGASRELRQPAGIGAIVQPPAARARCRTPPTIEQQIQAELEARRESWNEAVRS